MFSWVLDTYLKSLRKWSHYIYARRRVRIYINGKETKFNERSNFFEKFEIFRECKSN